MNAAPHDVPPSSAPQHRAIGPWGTAARTIVGAVLLGSVIWGHARGGVNLGAWLIGLVAIPALTIAVMRWRAARRPERLRWLTGPIGHPATFGAFLTLYTTTWYAPSISVLSDAALVFAGTTMLVAAFRGYAGCEALAISNWILRRDDQVGCLVFDPVDVIERSRAHRFGRAAAPEAGVSSCTSARGHIIRESWQDIAPLG